MKHTVFKRGTSLFLAFLMSFTALFGIGTTTAFAAGEKGEAVLIAYPREGDENYSQTTWGREDMTLMNGWSMMKSKYFSIFTMNSYSGNICYCIDPGTVLEDGDVFEQKDETFFGRGILIWSDGNYAPGVGDQDTITYGQQIDDPVKGFLNIKVSYGSAKNL